ncbi:FAD-dependent monooxygenase [Aliikangiella marina]|uniref:Kynurenine 3-monooxygenase n=1 Tax=Aliikangiella marina TaxID=1712262 RepID=A0A545T9C4_9GAMM|nr:NAD(P)/FAD-dependent oxidoreductase [Aliikangiella marina]TQV73821.1 FAD-dependent monooxygenase [Aliikangiella marina]
MANQNETITLIGAGLVGSLLAVMLAKRGFKVEVYERRPDMRATDISAGRSINLALANRGIYPLQQAGLMEQVKPILTAMKGRMVHDMQGNQNFQSYGQRPEEVIYSVSRGDLNIICLNAAEATGRVNIYFNQNCQKVDLDNNQLTIKDELSSEFKTIAFNRVIGTDGSNSAVREAIHAIESSQHDIISLGHSYKELRIPPGPNGEFLIDKHSLHIWPKGGYMIIALPNEDGSFTVTLFMANEGEISFESVKTPEQVEQFFNQHFPSIVPLLPDLQKDFFENPTGKLATVKCSPWHFKDKALLLGDAAHAVVPFHGQGMNCGFEDALDLIETIDEYGDDWAEIFTRVDEHRKINGDAIADMAIENYITMRDSVTDEKFLLRNALAFELENRFPKHFCPRYSMVMFHRLPYAEAKSRGVIQEDILKELTADVQSVEQVDFEQAESLIYAKLTEVNLNP